MIEDDTDSKFKSEFIQELKKMSHDKLLKYKSAAIILSSFIDIIAVLIILFMFIFPKFLIFINKTLNNEKIYNHRRRKIKNSWYAQKCDC